MQYSEIITICNEIKEELKNIEQGTSTYTLTYSDMEGMIKDYKSTDMKNLLRIFGSDWDSQHISKNQSFLYESFSTIHLDPNAIHYHLGDDDAFNIVPINSAEDFFQYSTILSYKHLLLSTVVSEFKYLEYCINISGSFVRKLLCEKL